MRSKWFGIVAAFFTLMLIGPSVQAQTLGTCTGTCTSTEIDDYGNCTIITESSMMDTMDPSDVAGKTNLSASLVSGEVQVSVDIDEPAGVVIPVNAYNGDWPDLDTLHGYLEELYDFGLPNPPECNEGQYFSSYAQTGAIVRWDPDSETWAPDQTQNVVLAAITSKSGELFIDGNKILGAPVLTTGCLTVTDGPLEGTTCSRIKERPWYLDVVCDTDEYDGRKWRLAIAEEKEIKWNGFTTTVETSGSLGSNLRFEIKRVMANVLANGRFYNVSGTFSEEDSDDDYDDYAGVSHDAFGVCTIPGDAERDQATPLGTFTRYVRGVTRIGTAPTTCPAE